MSTPKHVSLVSLLFAALLLTALPGSADAQELADLWSFELYAGNLFAGDAVLDDSATYGVRFGYRPKPKYGWQVQVGRFASDLNFGDDRIHAGFYGVDLSVFYFGPTRRRGPSFYVFGGPGLGFSDFETSAGSGFSGSESDTTFTLNGGVGVTFSLNDKTYLRPEVRGRYIEQGSDLDFETTLSIGFAFGGRG